MAANYFYPFGHGGGQFSVSSGSYPGGYSGPSSNSRGQQQLFNEQHSQLPYNAFANQLEQNASYGENKAYYVSTSPSSSIPSYTSSAGDDARHGAESKYQTRFQMQSASLNSDNPSYLGSGVTSSKSSYSGSKPSDNWHGAGAVPGASLSHGLAALSDAGSTQSSIRVELPVFKASPSSMYYRNSTTGNQSWGNVGSTVDRKPLPFGSRPRPRQPPKPSQLHYCEVCRISCAGSQTYMEHLEGKNHKKKEAQTKAAESSGAKVSSATGAAGLRQLYCQLCDVACTGADTYAAHIRGAKHQKVLNLHTKLGKPIPEVQSTDGGGGRGDGGMMAGIKKVIPAKMNFMGGSQLNTSSGIDGGTTTEIVDGNSTISRDEIEGQEDVADVQPVGLEYIEESRNETGSAVSFHCKLCNCNFTDPLAKVMHTKGRRHRLNYKQKVDPTLPVSMKPGSSNQKFRQLGRQTMKAKRSRDEYWRRHFYGDPYRQEVEELRYEKECLQWQLSHALERYDWLTSSYSVPSSDSPPSLFAPICHQATETQDDQHVKAKHASIYPTEEDLAAVQGTVLDCESTLKFVSDLFASASEGQNLHSLAVGSADVTVEPKEPPEEATPVPAPPRELKAVVRVGALSKGLLLHGNLNLELIVLCNNWPTFEILNRVMEEFTKKLNETAPDRYAVSLSPEGVDLVVTSLAEPKTTCTVSLTSLSVKGGSAKDQGAGDRLDHGKCLKSLAALRHAKWFQGKASCLFSCVILVRILKDICHRIPTWSHLSHWSLEVLAEKCLSSCEDALQPGAGLRRILECISSGLLLNGGPGLYDPCEKDPTDVFECLSSQQKEDITVSAQHALRLLAFGQIHKILDMEPLPSTRFPAHRRKRQRAADCQAQQGTSVGDLQPAEN